MPNQRMGSVFFRAVAACFGGVVFCFNGGRGRTACPGPRGGGSVQSTHSPTGTAATGDGYVHADRGAFGCIGEGGAAGTVAAADACGLFTGRFAGSRAGVCRNGSMGCLSHRGAAGAAAAGSFFLLFIAAALFRVGAFELTAVLAQGGGCGVLSFAACSLLFSRIFAGRRVLRAGRLCRCGAAFIHCVVYVGGGAVSYFYTAICRGAIFVCAGENAGRFSHFPSAFAGELQLVFLVAATVVSKFIVGSYRVFSAVCAVQDFFRTGARGSGAFAGAAGIRSL